MFKLVVNRWSKGSERVQAQNFKILDVMRSILVALCRMRLAIALNMSSSVRCIVSNELSDGLVSGHPTHM